MAQISNNCFDLTRLLSQFVLSRYARHKLRQLRLAGQANVRQTPSAPKEVNQSLLFFMTQKLISWNVNGIRSVLQKGFEDFVKKENKFRKNFYYDGAFPINITSSTLKVGKNYK